MMRLRQVALASRRLDAVVSELHAAFGLKVAYNDPHIIHYGLRNAVLPAGKSFIEVVEPVRADASAGRFLDRCGGDAGYMLILQTDDAARETARVEALGVRVVDRLENREYRASHFHPADFGGVLVSFDQQLTSADLLADFGDWMPAGPDWRAARTDRVEALESVTIACADPKAMALRWSGLLDAPIAGDTRLLLERGEICFEAGGPRTNIARIGLKADAPADVLIGGVRFTA
jgi:hypothetical protein